MYMNNNINTTFNTL